MEELLKKVITAKTRIEKQNLSLEFMVALPQFLKELGELEQRYLKGLKTCADAEGSKARAELLMGETDLHREYKYKRRLYDTILSTIKVLDMYTGGDNSSHKELDIGGGRVK